MEFNRWYLVEVPNVRAQNDILVLFRQLCEFSFFANFPAVIFSAAFSLSIRPSYGAREEEILDGGGGRGRRERFLSFTSLPFSLPFFHFSPETPDTQARLPFTCASYLLSESLERASY